MIKHLNPRYQYCVLPFCQDTPDWLEQEMMGQINPDCRHCPLQYI